MYKLLRSKWKISDDKKKKILTIRHKIQRSNGKVI